MEMRCSVLRLPPHDHLGRPKTLSDPRRDVVPTILRSGPHDIHYTPTDHITVHASTVVDVGGMEREGDICYWQSVCV